MEIFDFAVSCGCVEFIEPHPLSIKPGATASVRVKLDLTKRNSDELGKPRRSFQVEIQPLRKAASAPRPGWLLHGIIKSRVTVDTLSLDYGAEAVRGQTPLARKVTATVHIGDAKLQARVYPDLATVSINPSKDSSSRFQLVIAPRPTLPAGPFSCKLYLDVVTNDGDRLPGCILPIAGNMQPEVRALPAVLVFGPRRMGESAEATVSLQIPPGENWLVDHIEIDSDDVRVEPVALPFGVAKSFRVRQRISKSGHQSSLVRFFVRKGNNDPVPSTMKVSYDGDENGILSGAKMKEGER